MRHGAQSFFLFVCFFLSASPKTKHVQMHLNFGSGNVNNDQWILIQEGGFMSHHGRVYLKLSRFSLVATFCDYSIICM